MSTEDAASPRGSLPRRAARAVARPVTDPMHRRFDAVEQRVDTLTQMVTEVRDRVEADLASLVELTLELQRVVEGLGDTGPEPDERQG